MTTICPECGSAELLYLEVRGHSDGPIVLECVACGHLWPRFPDGALHARALAVIDTWKRGGVNV